MVLKCSPEYFDFVEEFQSRSSFPGRERCRSDRAFNAIVDKAVFFDLWHI